MIELQCDRTYEVHFQEYNETIFRKYGVSSRSAEREVLYMADCGNTIALKLYGDMVFYQKILRKHCYREAFALYMRSAGITVDFNGFWRSNPVAYPLSYWWIGYYLVNYRRESYLSKCEAIPEIDRMSLENRLLYALELAAFCLDYEKVPGAINLIGRILREIAGMTELPDSMEVFEAIRDTAIVILSRHESTKGYMEGNEHMTSSDIADLGDCFFQAAAREGYVYACNNLAAKEADRIVELAKQVATGGEQEQEWDNPDEGNRGQMDSAIRKYVEYLTIAANRYEPYAANRLGLFYRTGEIIGTSGSTICKDYIDGRLAKEYFIKATIYPDANSAWAYLNLMKYYHKDYDTNIELMNEHMEYIKELNPEVYDIAMEL